MAKKRLKIKDKQGNVVNYDISAANITIDAEGKSLDIKLSELVDAIAARIRSITFNGENMTPNIFGGISISQEQPNWSESNPNHPSFIQGKPSSVVNEVMYDPQTRKLSQKRNNSVEDVLTLPEPGSQVTFDTQMSSTSENGVQNKVIKAYVDAVSQRIDTLIGSGNVQGAIDTFNEVVAFLNGINSSDTLAAKLLLKADKATTYTKTEVDQKVAEAGDVKSVSVNNGTPNYPDDDGNVNISVQAGGASVIINSDGANIVDGISDSILTASSSRMMKEIYLNLQALFSGLAAVAFSGTKPTWQSVAIPTHTITLGTMTNVSASINGTPISDSASATEGEVTILLTPSSNNYMGSISVKDANSNDVTFTQTDVAGGTEISFILSGNVTISASASSGIQVNVSGTGISSYTTGVPPSTAAQLTIALPEHHTWGTISVSYGGVDITSQCQFSSANNADKVITLPNNLSDMSKAISIVANAVEDVHVTLALSGTNFVVKQGSTQLQNGSKVYNGSAAQTLSIEPASDCKFSTLPTADKGTMTNNGYYEASSLVIGTSLSGTLTISAQGAALTSCNVVLPNEANITASLTDLNGNALTTPVTEGSAVRITLAPIGDVSISISSATMVGTGNLTFSDNNGTKSVEIAHVTGNISVSATAAEVGKANVTYNLRNMVKSSDNTTNGKVNQGGTFTATLATGPLQTAEINNSYEPKRLDLWGSNNGVDYPGEWSTPHVIVKMGGVEQQNAYNASTGVVTINNVTDDIEVTAITESKVYKGAELSGTTVSPKYPTAISYSDSDVRMGFSTIYLKVPDNATKIRWCHQASHYNAGTAWGAFLWVHAPTVDNEWKNAWGKGPSRSEVPKSGNYTVNYQDVDVAWNQLTVGYTYMVAQMWMQMLSQCFLVDLTDVDADALAAADATAVVAYNTANGTSYTVADRKVSASLDDIVALGGKVIFDGRYAEFMEDPNANS